MNTDNCFLYYVAIHSKNFINSIFSTKNIAVCVIFNYLQPSFTNPYASYLI